MGMKRPHSEAEPSGNQEGGRPRTAPQKHWSKRQKVDVSEENFGAIKKRARAIERLLARDNLKIPADKQIELERELAAHKQRIAEGKARKHRSYMIGKYHMVRFFERQKATRLAKQLRRQLAELKDADEIAKVQADLHIAEVDLDYAIYYPFLETYVSLYASPPGEKKGDKPTAAQYLHAPRPPMWTVIEKAREEGKVALEKVQNRQAETVPDEADSSAPMATGHAKTHASNKKQERQQGDGNPAKSKAEKERPSQKGKSWEKTKPSQPAGAAHDDGGDSDGGDFFEED